MHAVSNTFTKIKNWISLNRNVANTVQHRLTPNFKKFVLTLTKDEQHELIYDEWVSKDLELTDKGFKALIRMAELIN